MPRHLHGCPFCLPRAWDVMEIAKWFKAERVDQSKETGMPIFLGYVRLLSSFQVGYFRCRPVSYRWKRARVESSREDREWTVAHTINEFGYWRIFVKIFRLNIFLRVGFRHILKLEIEMEPCFSKLIRFTRHEARDLYRQLKLGAIKEWLSD